MNDVSVKVQQTYNKPGTQINETVDPCRWFICTHGEKEVKCVGWNGTDISDNYKSMRKEPHKGVMEAGITVAPACDMFHLDMTGLRT